MAKYWEACCTENSHHFSVQATYQDSPPVTEVHNIQPWFALIELGYFVAEIIKLLVSENNQRSMEGNLVIKSRTTRQKGIHYTLKIQLYFLT